MAAVDMTLKTVGIKRVGPLKEWPSANLEAFRSLAKRLYGDRAWKQHEAVQVRLGTKDDAIGVIHLEDIFPFVESIMAMAVLKDKHNGLFQAYSVSTPRGVVALMVGDLCKVEDGELFEGISNIRVFTQSNRVRMVCQVADGEVKPALFFNIVVTTAVVCSHCGADAPVGAQHRFCKGCRLGLGQYVAYCDRGCQARDWPMHRMVCGGTDDRGRRLASLPASFCISGVRTDRFTIPPLLSLSKAGDETGLTPAQRKTISGIGNTERVLCDGEAVNTAQYDAFCAEVRSDMHGYFGAMPYSMYDVKGLNIGLDREVEFSTHEAYRFCVATTGFEKVVSCGGHGLFMIVMSNHMASHMKFFFRVIRGNHEVADIVETPAGVRIRCRVPDGAEPEHSYALMTLVVEDKCVMCNAFSNPGRGVQLARCARCLEGGLRAPVQYCSHKCQHDHFESHRLVCGLD